jgi:peptidyl-prolyl cis-trans isomerase A (cyclophilin A)
MKMSKTWLALGLLVLASAMSAHAAKKKEDGSHIQPDNLFPKVEMHTTMGKFVIELDRYKAPITVNNFLRYVEKRMYDNTVFHRVVPNFVIQGGGYSVEYEEKPSLGEIFNESGNGLKNDTYTIAMARQNDPHTATRQFYFNLNDNESLNPGRNWGYTVFGLVIEGSDVLDAMGQVETEYRPLLGMATAPVENIVLEKVVLLPEPIN